MKRNILKALVGAAAVITTAAVVNKVIKETNFNELLKDVTIDLDALIPKEEKVINPNGEDYTVEPEYVRIDEKPISDESVSGATRPAKSSVGR